MDHFLHYGMAASLMAKADAGLEVTEANAERIGALIGAASVASGALKKPRSNCMRAVRTAPFYIPSTIINMMPGQLSLATDQGAHVLCGQLPAPRQPFDWHGNAHDPVRRCRCDVCRVERGSSPTAMGGFCAMKAMSTRNEDPARASRPGQGSRWFCIGRRRRRIGAGRIRTRQARGARIYRELAGGASSDAFHMTAPSENGEAPAAWRWRSRRRGEPEDVGYLNAHGTSTRWAIWRKRWRSSVHRASTPTR